MSDAKPPRFTRGQRSLINKVRFLVQGAEQIVGRFRAIKDDFGLADDDRFRDTERALSGCIAAVEALADEIEADPPTPLS